MRRESDRRDRTGNGDEDEVQMGDGKSLMPRTIIRLRERSGGERIAKYGGKGVGRRDDESEWQPEDEEE